jgi:hypothetical protein
MCSSRYRRGKITDKPGTSSNFLSHLSLSTLASYLGPKPFVVVLLLKCGMLFSLGVFFE